MTATLLDVCDVHKRYGPIAALDGVSFHVAEGEMFGLLGPNGAGKTTLLSIVSGLLQPTSGTVRVRAPDARRAIGIVPQELAIYLELSARENLRRVEPASRGVRAGDCDEPAEELVSMLVLDQMVSQDPGRLLGVDFRETACPQVSDEAAERCALPDEVAIPCPCDQIDMHVDLGDAGRRPSRSPRFHARDCTEAPSRKER